MIARKDNPGEHFNSALEAFTSGELETAVACLRVGFFENLYIAAQLVGEEAHPQEIWYPGPEARPDAAMEYVERFGFDWKGSDAKMRFLQSVWSDPLVRRELENFISLSRALERAPDERTRNKLLDERLRYTDRGRIDATQAEILYRLRGGDLAGPSQPPVLDSLYLAAADPVESVEFYRKLLNIEPRETSRQARGCAEFELSGFKLVIHGLDQQSEEDPFSLGPRPASLGWGSVLVLGVQKLDGYLEQARRHEIEILDSELEAGESMGPEAAGTTRFFVVKDPSGYLIQLEERG